LIFVFSFFTAVILSIGSQIATKLIGHSSLDKLSARKGLQNSCQEANIIAMVGYDREDRFAEARRLMVARDIKARGITNLSVLRVMAEIHREEFVPASYQSMAYADGPLPIGCSQTISQPYIVALMTETLRLKPDSEILEIGTGCGYQTAILAKLAKRVYTIERIGQLSEAAQAILGRLGIDNVEFFIGDGSCGWPQKRTFDRIIVTAAAPEIPPPLQRQLVNGGFMVVPVGGGVQRLIVCEKKSVGMTQKAICDVRFVKLVGEHGFEQ